MFDFQIDDADDEEFYISGRGQSVNLDSRVNEPSVNLDVKNKVVTLDSKELSDMKLDLARFVAYSESTAMDDATSAVLALINLDQPKPKLQSVDDDFQNLVISHVLRYLKVSFCLFFLSD